MVEADDAGDHTFETDCCGGGGEMDEYYEYRRTARRPNNAFVRDMFAIDSTL